MLIRDDFGREISKFPGMPPVCKRCHRTLKRKTSLGFWNCIEEILKHISNPYARITYGCTGKVRNNKMDLWKEDCKKIEEENKKIRKKNQRRRLMMMNEIPEKPLPPKPPKMIPCPQHYHNMAMGKYNQRIVRKREQVFYE